MSHIYLCECNSKLLWQELILVIHGYVKSRFAFARTVEIKGLCLQLKRSGTEHTAQKINSLTSTVANGRPLLPRKVSLGFDKLVMSYYLFIFSSHHYSYLNLYNSGTRRDIKKQSTEIFLIFCWSFKFSNKKKTTFHLHFKGDKPYLNFMI